MGIRKSIAVCAIALGGTLGGNVQAVTLSGATVDYSFDDSLLNALFGTFSVIAGTDTLQFLPLTWLATADSSTTPGGGFKILAAITPLITVSAKTGYTLNGISLYERGDYDRVQFDPGNTSYAAAAGQFIVNGDVHQIVADDVGESDGKLDHVEIIDPPSGSGATEPWDIEAWSEISGSLAVFQVQNVIKAGIKNNLSAAFIQKKAIEFSVGTTVVPLPPAAWMLGSALVGLVAVGRRKLNV